MLKVYYSAALPKATTKTLMPLAFATTILASCTLGPDYKSPTAKDAPVANGFSTTQGAASVNRQAKILWWTKFRDRKLDNLVTQALAQNLNVMQALERVNAAGSTVRQVGGARYPSALVRAEGTRESDGLGNIANSSNATLSGSWLIDLTGRNRRNLETALAQLESSEANVVAEKLVMVGDLVQTYIKMRGSQAEAQVVRNTVVEIRRITALTQRQFDNGIGTALDVKLAEARLSEARIELPLILAQFDAEINHLATLLARPVQDIRKDLVRGAPQPIGRGAVSVGVPADLIRNRYDIRSFERNLASIYAQIGVAEADLYPSLSLGGSITSGTGPNTWSFGPQISLPILNRVAARSRVEKIRSQAQENYLLWRQLVLQAVEQVETAQARRARQQQSITLSRRAVNQLSQAQELALESYERGLVPLQQVIDVNRLLSTARSTLARSRTDLGLSYAELQIALGGFVE